MNPFGFAYIVAGILTVTNPSGSKLDKVPEPVLIEGLTTISNCVAIDVAGIRRLAELAERTENESQELISIQLAANGLLIAITNETKVGAAIISTLITEYKRTKEELTEKLKTQMEETRDDLKESFANATNYDELVDVIAPKLEKCDKAILHWVDQVEKYTDPDGGFTIEKLDDGPKQPDSSEREN